MGDRSVPTGGPARQQIVRNGKRAGGAEINTGLEHKARGPFAKGTPRAFFSLLARTVNLRPCIGPYVLPWPRVAEALGSAVIHP
jgi:hypothetical protein